MLWAQERHTSSFLRNLQCCRTVSHRQTGLPSLSRRLHLVLWTGDPSCVTQMYPNRSWGWWGCRGGRERERETERQRDRDWLIIGMGSCDYKDQEGP